MKNRRPTPETPREATPYPGAAEQFEKILVLQSPLSPRIPISSLESMPDDGSIRVLKQFQTDLCNDAINRLYSIVPDLDDRPLRRDSPNGDSVDLGVEIVRAWFRIMILNDSEAEVLEHASRSRCIDEFLAGCQASRLLRECVATPGSTVPPRCYLRANTGWWRHQINPLAWWCHSQFNGGSAHDQARVGHTVGSSSDDVVHSLTQPQLPLVSYTADPVDCR